MSAWLFKTVVTSSLLYQNAQLSSIGQTLEEIQHAQQLDRTNEEFLKLAKEKVYLIRKGLEGLRRAANIPPVQAYFHARMVERFLSTLHIDTATFPSFEDKHYYDEALTILDSVRDASKQAIGKDQSSSVDLYITTEEALPIFRDYIGYKRALDFVRRADVAIILSKTARSETPFIGSSTFFLTQLGAFLGACLLGGAFGSNAFLFGFLCLLGGGMWVAYVCREASEASKRDERRSRLLQAGLWAEYDLLQTKSENMALTKCNDLGTQLRGLGINVQRPTPDLEAELKRLEAWAQSCRALLQPLSLPSP